MSHNHSTDAHNETYLYENNQEHLYLGHSHGTKDLWKVFIWLSIITVVDIVLYFMMPPNMGRNLLFVALGLVKAFLIVGTFMHLKYERMNLILIIVVPMLFIVGLVMALLKEGGSHMMM